MAQPTQSDLHVNRPLTDMSVMAVYSNDEFVADKVFPNIAVDKRSDLYFKYNKDDFNRDTAQERAPGAESAGDGFSVSTDSYSAKVVALHHDIPDQNRANTDEPLNEDEDAAILLTHKLLLKREIDWASAFFTTGVWTGTTTGTDIVPGTKWDNASGTPIKDIKAQIIAQKKLHGFRPNTLVERVAGKRRLPRAHHRRLDQRQPGGCHARIARASARHQARAHRGRDQKHRGRRCDREHELHLR
jgi:hypothetical protein